jgi:hypothetical protein
VIYGPSWDDLDYGSYEEPARPPLAKEYSRYTYARATRGQSAISRDFLGGEYVCLLSWIGRTSHLWPYLRLVSAIRSHSALHKTLQLHFAQLSSIFLFHLTFLVSITMTRRKNRRKPPKGDEEYLPRAAAPRTASARKAPETSGPCSVHRTTPAYSRKSVPAEQATSAETEPGTSVPKLMLRFPVSLAKSGCPRKTTTTPKAGNDELPRKIQDPRESDPPSQSAPVDPVEGPAAPAQVPHTLETLLQQASGPDVVRFH